MITRGSEWKKWDLHLHSKYSRETRTKMEIKDIFECAVNNNIKMISITDHSNFDSLDEIWDIYENGSCSLGLFKDLIDFLPGIELKTDKGKNGVHLISIFPKAVMIKGKMNKSTKSTLYDNFCSKVDLTVSAITSNGQGNYSNGLLASPVNLENAVNLTHELGGLIIVHGGDKHGSIESEMNHSNSKDPSPEELYQHLDITKAEIMSEKIDVIEIPNFNCSEAKNAKFYMQYFGKPCMVASDSHEKTDYDVLSQKCTWVKADCTFEGLRQALIDYDNRICLKEIPEQVDRINKNATKYIDRVCIDWQNGYTGDKGKWFKDLSIPLNPGLVSIIGNKGNGKSALAEVIAWTSDNKNYNKFAFLNNKKFLKNKMANNFECKVKWLNSPDYIVKNLGELPNINNVEGVQCIPQQYFEEICTDTELQKFTSEINSVIFSRLSDEDKEGEKSLESLIDKYSSLAENSIAYSMTDMMDTNKQIIELEKKLLPPYMESQNALLKNAKDQLEAHSKICPTEVKKPELSADTQKKYEKIAKDINDLQTEIEVIENEKSGLLISSNELKLVLDSIIEFENRFLNEKKRINEKLFNYKINIDDIIKININKQPIEAQKKRIDDRIDLLKNQVDNEDNGLKKIVIDKENIKKSILADANKDIIAYDKYLKDYQDWTKTKNTKEESVRQIEDEIEYVNSKIQNDLDQLYQKRLAITYNIFTEKKKIIQIYDRFKKPVDDFIEKNRDLLNDYSICIRSGLVIEESFQQELFDFINKQKKNAFRDDNYQLFKTVEELNEIDNFDDYNRIPTLVLQCIQNFSIDVASQIKDNKLLDFYNYLFGMKYIYNKYELISDNKTLDKLSPGERGALLLIFYLLLDLRDTPLIIDQPEDNLDNQSVSKVLVPFIQAAKNRRQIILVTHNPNLAVVADSDQIIHVKIDKEDQQQVHIEAGGIENSEINKCIVTILEGTMHSFKRREEKYIEA